MYPEMSVAQYRDYAKLRVEALNHALRDIPRERITLHCCWGSFHGPHKFDIPLEEIVDIIFSVKAKPLLDRGLEPGARARVGASSRT